MEGLNRAVRHVDVLIVGGGPVGVYFPSKQTTNFNSQLHIGLITAIQLAKFGHSGSIAVIEKYPKSSQDQYGRAITLYPRSSEILDQLGLADELAQECFACRSTVSYDKDGNEVQGRGWYFMENMKDTQWDCALVLRQKYQEEIFRRRLKELGVKLEAAVELIQVNVDDAVSISSLSIFLRLPRVIIHSDILRLDISRHVEINSY
jgi:phenol 2-monooxygenase